jgi:uncharacterized protein with von Willebrand factor type A (vWA) domain
MAKQNEIVVGRARALRSETQQGIVWWQLQLDGSNVGVMTAEQFAVDGRRALEAYNGGQDFKLREPVDGVPLTPEEILEARADRLQRGPDATLVVDEWTRDSARRELDEGGSYSEAVARYEHEQWPTFERELFATLYADPEAVPEEERAAGVAWMQEIHTAAAQLPEWQRLRERAAGDQWLSGMAANTVTSALAKTLEKVLEKLPKEDPARLQDNAETLKELCGEESEPAKLAAAVAAAQAKQAEDVAAVLAKRAGEVRGVLRAAVAEANREAQETAMLVRGIGGAPGELSACQAPPEAIRRALSDNPKLKQIAKMAGRLKPAMQARQRAKSAYVPEQMVDVELGAELARLLPSETLLLAGEETELVLMRRIAERQALQYRLEGHEKLERGPIVLCVDGSGSMMGFRNVWAMAVALALCDLAAKQRRAFALVHFDSIVQKVFMVPPGDLSLDLLVEMVCYFSGGGTNFAPPLERARQFIVQTTNNDLGTPAMMREADVILVTDGGGGWGEEVQRLNAVKARVFGVAIDSDFTEAQKGELTGHSHVTGHADGDALDLVFGL